MESFEVGNGVKQGCVLAPHTVRDIIFSVVFTDSTQGVWIERRSGANMFNVRQLSLQERPEIFLYVSSFLVMTLPLWHTTTKTHRK